MPRSPENDNWCAVSCSNLPHQRLGISKERQVFEYRRITTPSGLRAHPEAVTNGFLSRPSKQIRSYSRAIDPDQRNSKILVTIRQLEAGRI